MLHQKKRLEAFEALRALCCISVIGVHCYVWELGYVGLAVFFMLSGFLLVYNYYDRTGTDRPGLGQCLLFSWKKIKKLLPLHIITLLFFLAENAYALITGLARPTFDFFLPGILNLFLVQSWVPRSDIYFSLNVPTWYLSVCVFLYAAFPLILRAVRRFKGIAPAVICSAAVFAAQTGLSALGLRLSPALDALMEQESGSAQWVLQVCPLLRLGSFIIGCNLGYIFLKTQEKEFSPLFATAFELLTAAVIFFTFNAEYLPAWLPLPGKCFDYSLKFMPAAVMLIFAFAYGDGFFVKLLTNRALLWLGELSSYMYILHWLVLNVVSVAVTRLPLAYGAQRAIYLSCIFIGTTLLAWLYRRCDDAHRRKKVRRA